MREISFLEKLAENVLEGGFLRALKPKLQPVQLAKALTKEMERSRLVGPESPMVANQYRVYLNPSDFALFSGFQANLERELASYLRGYASRRGYRPISAIAVTLVESSVLSPSKVRTEGLMADSPAPAPFDHSVEWRQGTMEMAAVHPGAPHETGGLPAVGQPPAALVSEEGELIPLTRPLVSIGRAVDNDVVLETKSVSRRHAQIRWDSSRYVLEDLGSTNGSFVSGEKVSRRPLADGEEIAFGGVRFIFRLAAG
jgi:hypothetical protein